uniref:Uncharacterized protein n=1 Tax=Schizaphis graminum TaxID=13262 RepID=A0A2S2NED4_SCHGA
MVLVHFFHDSFLLFLIKNLDLALSFLSKIKCSCLLGFCFFFEYVQIFIFIFYSLFNRVVPPRNFWFKGLVCVASCGFSAVWVNIVVNVLTISLMFGWLELGNLKTSSSTISLKSVQFGFFRFHLRHLFLFDSPVLGVKIILIGI